jgi:uncharacterized DUF497 family protein
MFGFRFEWDDDKAARNLRKQGVSFEEAVSVFGDPNALTFSDTEPSARNRQLGLSRKRHRSGIIASLTWSEASDVEPS